MKKYWSEILFYGLALGLLLASLQFFQYKWVLLNNTAEWYVGLIALLFTLLGIWAGNHFFKKKAVPVAALVTEGFEVDKAAIEKLGLSPRELEVLALIAQGLSNQEIADRLFVSLNTIKTHISNLLSKLGAERRTQAIQKAKAFKILP
jgi:two-component system, NarL family, response regulator LiaR